MKRLFLDLGDGQIIPKKKVVLLLNAETATQREATRAMIRKNKREEVLPKRGLRQVNTIVLTNAYGKDSIYSSARSSKAMAGETGWEKR
jgi:hypothetical protein